MYIVNGFSHHRQSRSQVKGCEPEDLQSLCARLACRMDKNLGLQGAELGEAFPEPPPVGTED